MPDVLLNSDGDLARQTEHTSGLQEILQKITIRLRTKRGEWPLDDSVGVPYLEWLREKRPPLEDVEAVFRAEIVAIDGVEAVQSIDVGVDAPRESVDVSATIVTEEFGTAEFRKSIKIGG
jgi:hypothetical protein